MTMTESTKSRNKLNISGKRLIIANYIVFGIIFTGAIALFSMVMAGIASYRNDILDYTYSETGKIYSNNLVQSAPNIRALEQDSDYYISNKFSPDIVKRYVDNTQLTSTDGNVVINADFVKKGLAYQPTFRTNFSAKYILKNKLNEKSFVKFEFPFPANMNMNEISNAGISINGKAVENTKAKITLENGTYDNYQKTQVDGLKWEGFIDPNSQLEVEVKYDTVGLSKFSYNGIENSKGSQDFNFKATINGTRQYNIVEGLSVDNKTFASNSVTLVWNKPSLSSKPLINVQVGDKLNPSAQVARTYIAMTPIYVVFIAIILFLAHKFGKTFSVFDMFLTTVLFTIFFPLVHYLSSFTIDPTMEVFSNINVGEYSMPLYAAFGLAILIVGGLMYYLFGKISGFKFATKIGIPTTLLFIGFFPLVITIPEYSILLVLVGIIALIAIVVQVRVKLLEK